MSNINSDYFKSPKQSDTPIADSLAAMANKHFEKLGIEDRVTIDPDTSRNTPAPPPSSLTKGHLV
ncbi:MAG: hypothetical protein EXS67_04210 [Candidatus Margulisbacteria bacterium]|nr:hypothetical protein [Candidatus Margulisiibacteriota bacterium]